MQMVGKTRRSLSVILVSSLPLAGLTGCNRNWEILGPHAIGMKDGDVLSGEHADDSPLIWEAEGDAEAGHVFVVGASITG